MDIIKSIDFDPIKLVATGKRWELHWRTTLVSGEVREGSGCGRTYASLDELTRTAQGMAFYNLSSIYFGKAEKPKFNHTEVSMEIIKSIEFDPLVVSGGDFELKGRITLTNGQVRSLSAAGEMTRSIPEQTRISQGILLNNLSKVYCSTTGGL